MVRPKTASSDRRLGFLIIWQNVSIVLEAVIILGAIAYMLVATAVGIVVAGIVIVAFAGFMVLNVVARRRLIRTRSRMIKN